MDKIRLIEKPGIWAGPCGDCRRVLWVPGPWGQYSGKILLIEKPGVQDYGSRHVAKRSSDPRVAYPEVKVHLRDLVRVVRIVARGSGPCGDCRRVMWNPGHAG